MGDPFLDTIIAPATIAGTGAISLIRITGPLSLKVGTELVKLRSGSLAHSPAGRVHYGVIYDGESILDEVICYTFRAPHSYTGEDGVEISCHSSTYIVSRILEIACNIGCRMAEPGEFTRRAYLNGKMDLAQAEAVADLIESSTEASHRVAISQLKGGFSSELKDLRVKLMEMTSLLELELDFSEEELEFADRGKLKELLNFILNKISILIESFRLGNAIKNGVPVAIVGAANSGKSTLLNAILGEQRAIVSDIAGTTRDTVEECFNADGILFRFVDTAGIRNGISDEVEKMGIERSLAALDKAEIILLVIDSLTGISDELLNLIANKIDHTRQKTFLVFNKTDLIKDGAKNLTNEVKIAFNNKVNNKYENVLLIDNQNIIEICAKSGKNIPELISKLSFAVKKSQYSVDSDTVLITNARHFQALCSARESLLKVKFGIENSTTTDLIAEDLRASISSIGTITGEITSDEILGHIFSKFCIGK